MQEYAQENETHEILLDLEIQTDHRIPARRLDLVIINNPHPKQKKMNLSSKGFFCLSEPTWK